MAKAKMKKHEFKPYNYDGCPDEPADCLRMIVRHQGPRRIVYLRPNDWTILLSNETGKYRQDVMKGEWQAWEERGPSFDQNQTGPTKFYRNVKVAMKSICKLYDAGRHLKRRGDEASY